MKIKKFGAAFLTFVMCMGMFSTTAFAYSGAETDNTKEATEVVAEEKESEVETETEEELPYSYSVSEDGTIVFSFNGEEYTYDGEDETTGKVVTGGSRLNVRTGAGMNYEVIDQLRPGEEVSVFGTDGNWYQITVPAKTGYVHSDYLKVLENASNETDAALLQMFMMMFMDMSNSSGSGALTPDGNMTLVDDFGSATGEGKQFITLTTKNGNTFYLIIDRDDKGTETVHFLNLVDEADLLALMDEAQVTEYQNEQAEPVTEETEPTEPEVVEPEEPVEEEKPNMLPLILVIALIGGGGAFAFMQIKKKKEQKEAEKPDPDADYVDDDEDYGYVDVHEENEDDDEDTFYEEEDNEPV